MYCQYIWYATAPGALRQLAIAQRPWLMQVQEGGVFQHLLDCPHSAARQQQCRTIRKQHNLRNTRRVCSTGITRHDARPFRRQVGGVACEEGNAHALPGEHRRPVEHRAYDAPFSKIEPRKVMHAMQQTDIRL